MRQLFWTAIGLFAATGLLRPQAPGPVETPPPPQSTPPPAASPANSPSNQSSFLGRDAPVLDPGSEIVTWDGRNWNVSNNRLFQARFEKFLNAPDSQEEEIRKYQAILQDIMDKLAPSAINAKSVDEAFKLLPKASAFDMDANHCDALANQIYSAWLSRRNKDRLFEANRSLEEERKRLEWNARMTAQGSMLDRDGGGTNAEVQRQIQLRRDMEMQPLLTRLAEVNALLKANQLKGEVAEVQVKVEFQALLVQLFLQRRFQHVLIGTRFYRNIFSDGDSKLRVGKEARNLFSKTSGMPPTVGVLDTLANEIMRDVREGISAFKFLLERKELESATKRLAETFLIGEYVPEVRTLDRDDKRQALEFSQRANKLLSALEVKDYALAERIVGELAETAKDFDNSKAMAAIETARTVAKMHITKAKNAAVSGDRATLEEELRAAAEIWPRNPELAEVTQKIFLQADAQSRALMDFDQLLAQKNHRQIFDDRMRFIAATAMYPERQEQLRQVLDSMTAIEAAIIRAQEIEKRGDHAGAWESAERAFLEHPEDNKLNQMRSDLTTKAADFVRALREAQAQESKNQTGSSLAWYLKAQKEYPPSEFAREGIERLIRNIFPKSS